jgi:hypothetical protein
MHLRYSLALVALLAACQNNGDDKDDSGLDTDCVTAECDGDPWNDPVDDVEVTFTADVWPIIENRCAECHDSISNPPRMASDADVDQIVNAPASILEKVYVIPGDAGNSYLYQKITGQHLIAGGDGAPMPNDGTELSHVEVQFFADWIDGGALP